jgi:hypothetical protein
MIAWKLEHVEIGILSSENQGTLLLNMLCVKYAHQCSNSEYCT